MADARVREAWSHTSWLAATIINWAGRIARRPVKPEEVNPLLAKPPGSRGIRITSQNIGILKEVYVQPGKKSKRRN